MITAGAQVEKSFFENQAVITGSWEDGGRLSTTLTSGEDGSMTLAQKLQVQSGGISGTGSR